MSSAPQIDDKSIDHAMERLNNRPRKTLGFATPNEVFYKDTNNKNNVALIIWIYGENMA